MSSGEAAVGTRVGVAVLGPVQLRVDGADVDVPRGRQQLVLAHLVLRRGEPVAVARLTTALWGDEPPQDPANALQYVVARLRRLLEPGRDARSDPSVLVTVGDAYRLDLPAGAVDAERLEQAVADARQRPPADPERAAVLDAALAEWRGSPYAAFADDLALAAERGRLEQLRASALELQADGWLAGGRHDDVAATLSAVVEESWAATHEGLHARLAVARHRQGRQVEALAVTDRFAARLGEELGLDPSPAFRRLRDRVLRRDASLDAPRNPATGPVGVHARPPAPLGTLVGRDAEVALALDRLRSHRLVTLTGPPGAGKTRLAVEVGARRGDAEDGQLVAWASLDGVREPALVGPALLAAVGAHENADREVADVLAEACARAPMLLVVDDAEAHAGQVAAIVLDLLARVPGLRVLVTSQERLGVRGEAVLPVAPLAVPPDHVEAGGGSPPDLANVAAVALFVARAREHDPAWDDDLRDVARVVRLVDGLPLAVELAAGRARLLPAREIADRLGSTHDLLAAGEPDRAERHRSLDAALTWSLSLLDDGDRDALERLCVFASFDTGMAAAAADVTDLDVLARLVDRSLVVRDDTDGRFRLLGSLRRQVWSTLPAERAAELAARLVAWARALVLREGRRLRGPEQRDALHVLDREHGNLRNALMAATGPYRDLDAAHDLVRMLSRWWDWRGRFAEANRWLDRLDETRPDADAGSDAAELVGATLAWQAFSRLHTGEPESALELADRAVATGWHDGDAAAPAGLFVRTVIRRATGDLEGSTTDARTVLDLALAHGDDAWAVGWAWDALAHAVAAQGDVERATAYAQKSLSAFRGAGDDRGVAWALTGLADAARAGGDLRAMRQHAAAAARLGLDLYDVRNLAWSLELLAEANAETTPADALAAVGAVEVLRSEPTTASGSPEDDRLGPLAERLHARLGSSATEHLDRGRTLAAAADLDGLVSVLADHAVSA